MLSVLSSAGAAPTGVAAGRAARLGYGGRSEPLAHLVERGIERVVVLTFQRQ